MGARCAGVLAILGLAGGCDQVFDLHAPPHPDPLVFVSEAHAHDALVAAASYGVYVADGADRALIVAVMIGGVCGAPTPEVTAVAYGGTPLTQLATLLGTPCSPGSTRSEQWLLVGPAVGQADVDITLSGIAQVVHSGALVLVGVDQDAPVRATMTGSGRGTQSTVTVPSAIGDLVVNTTGQGSSIAAPGGEASPSFIDNVSAQTTLDNAAGSTAPGREPSLTSTWTFGADDEWQSISTSIQPAAPAL